MAVDSKVSMILTVTIVLLSVTGIVAQSCMNGGGELENKGCSDEVGPDGDDHSCCTVDDNGVATNLVCIDGDGDGPDPATCQKRTCFRHQEACTTALPCCDSAEECRGGVCKNKCRSELEACNATATCCARANALGIDISCVGGICLFPSCKIIGEACTQDGDCCSPAGRCNNGQCAAPEGCKLPGQSCHPNWAPGECCLSGLGVGINNICSDSNSKCKICTLNNYPCVSSTHCCSNFCNTSSLKCETPVPGCIPNGNTCRNNRDCCSGVCNYSSGIDLRCLKP